MYSPITYSSKGVFNHQIPPSVCTLVLFISSWIWISIIIILSKYFINIHSLQVKARNSAGLGQGLSGGPHSVSDGNNLVIINSMLNKFHLRAFFNL